MTKVSQGMHCFPLTYEDLHQSKVWQGASDRKPSLQRLKHQGLYLLHIRRSVADLVGPVARCCEGRETVDAAQGIWPIKPRFEANSIIPLIRKNKDLPISF